METIQFFVPTSKVDWLLEKNHLSWQDIIQARQVCSGNCTSWVLTTYMRLKKVGIPCTVVKSMPQQGIVIADRDSLGNQYPYLGDVMLICAKGDREFHPSAHMHIVHNASESARSSNQLWNPYFIGHWPQPDIIPRSSHRGHHISTIAFLGTRSNLAPELTSKHWTETLEDIGCQWSPRHTPAAWNDYSDIDVVIAVRTFNRSQFPNKPASKLINCWHAGVPILVPPESAFTALRKSPLDFIEICSIEDAITAIQNLQGNPQKYQAMVDNGWLRAKKYTEETILGDWVDFIESTVYPQYKLFQEKSVFQRRATHLNRLRKLKVSRLANKLK